VTLVSGPTALPAPAGVRRVDVESAREMAGGLRGCAAGRHRRLRGGGGRLAAGDLRPSKIKKGAAARRRSPGREPRHPGDPVEGARRGRSWWSASPPRPTTWRPTPGQAGRKGCDWIVANDVSIDGTMGGDDNAVAIVSGAGIERWDRMAKGEVARRLAARIAEEF
jgi:phosphopantothenoylcysteine decarboxylase/phosphopantothenate--cysteine ligase